MYYNILWRTRASFPRIRFDQLMSFCWTVLLPIVIAFVILVPCILYSFECIPTNISLLAVSFIEKKKDSLKVTAYKEETEDSVSLLAHSVYHNLHDKDTIVLIKKDLIKAGGVYTIVHNESPKQYIGSSVDVARRVVEHISNNSSNLHLQRAISKYGLRNFSLYIL